MRRIWLLILCTSIASWALVACGEDDALDDDGRGGADAGVLPDGGALPDGGGLADGGPGPDSGVDPDAGPLPDGAMADTGGPNPDAGPLPDGGPGPDADDPPPLGCDPEAASEDVPLRRLSHAQYLNTITDLLHMYRTEEEVQGFYDWGIRDLLDRLPPDEHRGRPGQTRGGFTRLDQVVHQEHVDVTIELAVAIANELAPTWRAEEFAGCDIRQDACVEQWIREFGLLTQRRPMNDDDVAFFRSVFADGRDAYPPNPDDWDADLFARAQGLRTTMTVMLASPEFLYHVEHGAEADPVIANAYRLGPYEVANRLAYHFWQTMPDEALYAAAADGSLLTPEGYEAQVERLYADPRTERSIREFFREWLRLDELPAMNRLNESDIFLAQTDGFQPSGELREAMIDEVLNLAVYFAQSHPGSFDAFFTSDLLLTASEEVAHLYGSSTWDGNGTPPALTDDARAGLITRLAMTASGSGSTRPIIKGVRMREALLCSPLPPPPDNAAAFPPELSDELTTREVVEGITEVPGTSCAGCHQTLINPYGFITENFGVLGQTRDVEILFGQWNQVVGERPVDTTTTVLTAEGPIDVADAHELTDVLLDGGDVHRCFADQYVSFTFGRPNDRRADACVVESLDARLRRGDSLADVLRDIAFEPSFQRRTIE